MSDHFRAKYYITKTHSNCRLCRWAYAKRYGFGWNHTRQEVQELRIPKTVCRTEDGWIGHPFQESWHSTATPPSSLSSSSSSTTTSRLHGPKSKAHCEPFDDSNRRKKIGWWRGLQRTIYTQDGVIDIVIDWIGRHDDTYIMRLALPIRVVSLKVIDSKQLWLEDKQSRITIVTNEAINEEASSLTTSLIQPRTIEFSIASLTSSSPLRIRIIIEDIDRFHVGADQRANYFGQLMTQDFLEPLQFYRVFNKTI